MASVLTWIGSQIWSSLSWGTRVAQRLGWIREERLGCRVISVGNIQAGGAGKTPLVARIANEAAERGLRAAILCRGYGGAWEVSGGILRPDSPDAPESGACGDEAALLRKLAPQAWIGVGADRIQQYRNLKEASGSEFDLVILDDGFQNRKIRKDVEIVAVTSVTPGQAFFRDWNRALKSAHLIVWTKGTEKPSVPPEVPFLRADLRLAPALTGADVALVTGVGDPADVERSAGEAGYRIARHVRFRDHARYDQKIIRDLLDQASQRNERVAITGKDWVKWRELSVRPEEVLVLEPEVTFGSDSAKWEEILWAR